MTKPGSVCRTVHWSSVIWHSWERRLGRWKEAEINYRRAIELAPRDLQLFVSFGGELLPYLKRFDEAQAALDHGLEFAPNDESLLANKAAVYQSDGKWDEAGQALARIPAKAQR